MTNCPTCDQKMHRLTISRDGLQTSVCRRCGTLTVDQLTYYSDISGTHRVSTWVPQLVGQCLEFEKEVVFRSDDPEEKTSQDALRQSWSAMGIHNTITHPGNRK